MSCVSRQGRAGWDVMLGGEVRCQEALSLRGPRILFPWTVFLASLSLRNSDRATWPGSLDFNSVLHSLHVPPAHSCCFWVLLCLKLRVLTEAVRMGAEEFSLGISVFGHSQLLSKQRQCWAKGRAKEGAQRWASQDYHVATDENKQEPPAGLLGYNRCWAKDTFSTFLSEFTTSRLKDENDFQTIPILSISEPFLAVIHVWGWGAGLGLSKQ